MSLYDEELKERKQRVQRKEYLERRKESLSKQKIELEEKTATLKKEMNKEQRDVNRIEGSSLAALFYNVVGKKEEKIEKERKEAYMAAVKYDTAVRELQVVTDDIEKAELELGTLSNCEKEYQEALAKKIAEIKNSNSPEAIEVFNIQEQISEIDHQIKETKEALEAGEAAQKATYQALVKLDDADGYATMDAFGSFGGIFTEMAKHDALDDAQIMIEELQIQLRRFQTELDDVFISADKQVNFGGFSRFADYFFDNIFVNWDIMEQIEESQEEVEEIYEQINTAIEQLESKEEMLQNRRADLQEIFEQLVIRA